VRSIEPPRAIWKHTTVLELVRLMMDADLVEIERFLGRRLRRRDVRAPTAG